MTVKELKQKLEILPPDMQVYAENLYNVNYKVKDIEVVTDKHNKKYVLITQEYG